MAQKVAQKVKGCRKCGRKAKRDGRAGSPISLFVRNKISAKEYFSMSGISFKG